MTQTAVFGGGGFWCTEAIFQRIRGVLSVTSGYAGGSTSSLGLGGAKPTYERVGMGNTGFAEVVKVEFDPHIIKYEELLDIFWHLHDPMTKDQQGADVGTQYRSIILYTNEEQRIVAQEKKKELLNSGEFAKPILTEIIPLDQFYTAEEYHQNFYNENKTYPYCQLVIDPKIKKLLSKYSQYVK